MRAADWKTGPSKDTLWGLVKFDLDWVAQTGTVSLTTCDLWEETVDPNFLWNRAMMRAALLEGSTFASMMGDDARASSYKEAAASLLKDPVVDHTASDGSLTECPAAGGSDSCQQYAKGVDGAVILSIIHSKESLGDSRALANTVGSYNEAFCKLYTVNRQDSSSGMPGVLYGRYVMDSYGGGNPWVLITSALASLLYQQAQFAQKQAPSGDTLTAWQRALNSEMFDGSAKAFVAAGDAVLSRLHAHVAQDDFRLFEQIDRETGKQYNAEDLTWSYAETLMALKERAVALSSDEVFV
jgi:glucoamylase